jgi:hypothetical protein
MNDILKTWPAIMDRRQVLRAFENDWGALYFSLGRGKPQREVVGGKLFFTHHGQILGSFAIRELLQFDGANIPPLRRISGEESAWQFKPDTWVAICSPPFARLKEKIFHDSFRGWRYFDLAEYSKTTWAKVRM